MMPADTALLIVLVLVTTFIMGLASWLMEVLL